MILLCVVAAVETLRQLILQDVEEDRWSHDSDDTPTNEVASERSPQSERQRAETLETVLKYSTDEWEAEPEEVGLPDPEQHGVHVMRKGNG